jgi:hypothetical protein
VSPELIGSLFTGLTGLLAGLAAFTATRSRRVAEDRKALRRRNRFLQRFATAALDHIFDLERLLSGRGLPVPARPAILEMDDDDDEPAARPSAAADAT